MTNERSFDSEFNISLTNMDLRKQFLEYITQPELCELFYNYMKSERIEYILEFYLACDGLKNKLDSKKLQGNIIELIYKYYLSNNKLLSSKKFSLPNSLLLSIKQRLIKHEYHLKFYDQAQEYVLKYMLKICYPKFLVQQTLSTYNPISRRSITIRKKDIFEKFKQQSNTLINPNSSEGSTLIGNNECNIKLNKQEKIHYNLAQKNPAAFFEEIKTRLLIYQTEFSQIKQSINDDDSFAILDLQIAKTIDDADTYLYENSLNYYKQSNHFSRYDSGIGTDSSETFYSLIDVIWYPSLDSTNALLSTIPYIYNNKLTFKNFRKLFKKQTTYRYFFKTICTPDINKEQYVFRELTMDDELVPFYDGKIFVQLDRIY